MSNLDIRYGLEALAKAIEKRATAQVEAARIQAEATVAAVDSDVVVLVKAVENDAPRCQECGGDRHRAPMDYCSEGAYAEPIGNVADYEALGAATDRELTEECQKTCPGFSQCRDLGCQRLAKPNDLHQGV